MWGHWCPCFGLQVTFALGFKPERTALFTLGGGISDVDLPSLKFISDATPADPLMASLSDGHCSSLEFFSRGSMLDSNGRPPAYQSKGMNTPSGKRQTSKMLLVAWVDA